MFRPRPHEGVKGLITAVAENDMRAVQELLRRGVNVSGRDRYTTPLICACANGNGNMAIMLLKARACVNGRNCNGQDALMQAVRGDNPGIASILIHAGADPLAKQRWGNTPLTTAAETGATSILHTFLRLSDRKRQRALWTASAFTSAVKAQCQKTLDYLFMKQAWPWSYDAEGDNAWEIALKTGQEAMACRMIESYCRDRYFNRAVTESTLAMAEQGCVKAVETLLRVNGSLDVVDEVSGATPLMLAAVPGHHLVVEVMLRSLSEPFSR